MADDYVSKITRLLRANGCRWRFSRRRRHRSVVVEHGGRVHTFIFPTSPSDRRGPQNAVSFIRRTLRLRRAAP